MPNETRLSQLYELQKVALINVNYYGTKISKISRWARWREIASGILSSGTVAAVIQKSGPTGFWGWMATGMAVGAAILAVVIAAKNDKETLAQLERMHSAYKILYHSTETLSKRTIGTDRLTVEQEAALAMLEIQLAVLGPQDEIDPDRKILESAQHQAEAQLPESYFYPQKV